MTFNQICWDFSLDEHPPYPILPLYLKNPDVETKELFNDFKVDTGFTGTIGINEKIIIDLELHPVGVTQVSTTIGKKNLPYYQLHIHNSEWELEENMIYAIKTERLLIGRSALNGKKFLIDFDKSSFCYLKNFQNK